MKNIQPSMLSFILSMVIALTLVDAVPRPIPMKMESALDLIILHNNDMHARFEQTDKFSSICHRDEVIANKCYGGFARVSEVLKDYRHEAESGGPSVLYLNAGDTYTGTPWFTIFKDRIVSDFLNILKPDAISLGNHELDLGIEGLIPFLNDAEFPVLVANLNNSLDHPLWRTRALKRSVVFDIKGYKVGVIGYLTPETKQVARPNDLEFIPEVIGINEESETLKNKGVNIIIALGHSGYDVDREIAKKCPLVDVVIGGHSNTFLYSGEQPDIEKIDGPYPTVVRQESGKEVPVVQAYAYTKYLGKLELSFNEDGQLINWGGQPILLNSSVIRDPEVLTLLAKYRPAVSDLIETVLGVTKVHLDGSECRAVECNIGNMVSDSLVYTRVKQYNGTQWTDAPIALVQGGGIRASAAVGNVTKFDLKTILPFNNTLLLLNITGRAIKEALERSVEQYTGDRGEFLQMSGLRVVYNMSKSPGHRVESVDVLCSDCSVPLFSKLDLNREYGVIMSEFLHQGGDGFNMFKEFKSKQMKMVEFDAVTQYLKNVQTVYPVIDGRITMYGNKEDSSGGSSIVSPSISIILILAVALLKYIQ